MWADLYSVIIQAVFFYIYTPVPNCNLSGAGRQRSAGTAAALTRSCDARRQCIPNPNALCFLPPTAAAAAIILICHVFLRRRLLRVLREASDLCARGSAGSRRARRPESEIISGTFHIGKRWWSRQTKRIDYFCLVWTVSGTVCFILQRSHFQSKSAEHIKEKVRDAGKWEL